VKEGHADDTDDTIPAKRAVAEAVETQLKLFIDEEYTPNHDEHREGQEQGESDMQTVHREFLIAGA
jgi:hypothetical protein